MIFITGGRAQGKSAFARALYRERYGVQAARVADGRKDAPEEALRAPLVLHLELFVRKLMEQGEDPNLFIERFLRENPDAVAAADEVGCGIVPMEAFERSFRDAAGNAAVRLAASSILVYRVLAGIPVLIKGKEEG